MAYGSILGKSATTWSNSEILSSETAGLFNLGNNYTPNDMFNALAHTGDLYVWKRTQNGQVDYPVSPNRNAYQEASDEQPATYVLGEVQTGSFYLVQPSVGLNITWYYSASLNVAENGTINLTDENSITLSSTTASGAEILKGKFIYTDTQGYNGQFNKGTIYFIPANASIRYPSPTSSAITVNQYQSVTGQAAIPANTSIEYLGQLGEPSAKTITGTYAGTGQGGSSNKNSLTLDFVPRIIFICGQRASWSNYLPSIGMLFNDGDSNEHTIGFSFGNASNVSLTNTLSPKPLLGRFSENIVEWYGNDEYIQLNSTGITYSYTAFS